MKSITRRRRIAVLVASAACTAAAFGAAGPASAQEPSGIDPQAELQQVLCVPEGSLLRPTGFCEVAGPSGIEGDRVNPYTPDGTSPGLLGLRVLGVL